MMGGSKPKYRYACIKCGERMVTRHLTHGNVTIDVEECLGCRGRYFDYNEFEKLVKGSDTYKDFR